MKPYGRFYAVDGCTCALCRSRGYRKGDAYGDALRASKHRARQASRREIKALIYEAN